MEFPTDEFDPSERRDLREILYLVRGNGKPGINGRLRRVEWLLYVVLAAIALAALDGRIRYHAPDAQVPTPHKASP